MSYIKYISLCSGVEAASLAWLPLDWEPVAYAEFDDFPSAVLAARFPETPNLGDVTKVDWTEYHGQVDVLVGGTPCFPAGTLVLTDRQLVPIEDIKVGDVVLTHKGNWKRVLKVGSKIADETVILKGQGTVGIECTPNHPFFSIKKSYRYNSEKKANESFLDDERFARADEMVGRMWLNVSASREELHVPTFRMKDEQSDHYLNESFFYFVGRWLGDGWLSEHKRLHRQNSIMKRTFVCCAHDLGDDLQTRLEETGLTFTRTEERTTTRFCCSSQPLYEWLEDNFGKGAANKHLPSWCFSMQQELREALYLGYIDADGTGFANGARTSSVSKQLTVGMKILAAGIGYASSVTYVENKRKECRIEGRLVNERPYYCQSYYLHSRSAVICSDGFWGRVRKILPGRHDVTVYNLEVEDDHSYTADGIAVHNCQSFSIAGRREGLLDSRGQLMLEFVRAVREIGPRYVLWENVPGCLSQDRGRAFGTFLRELAECGYACCWRVLDAQFVRVPVRDNNGTITGWVGPVAQRRRRVFLVAVPREYAGRAAAVLSLADCRARNPTPSSRKREELTTEASGGAGASGGDVTAFKWFAGAKARTMPAYDDGTTPTLTNSDAHQPAIAFAQNQRDEVRLVGGDGQIAGTVNAQRWGNHKNETLIAEPIVMASGQSNAEISHEGVAPTIAARNYKDPPILFEQPQVADE